jgi:regulatory protein
LRQAHRQRAKTPSDPGSPEAAYADGLKKLARQPNSRARLKQSLVRAGYETAAVDTALDRMEERGYLNDREYALSLVRRRSTERGRALIAQELRAKGIEGNDIASVLTESEPGGERTRALALARRLVRQGVVDRAKLGARLSRRGFSGGLVTSVLNELGHELHSPHSFDSPQEPD